MKKLSFLFIALALVGFIACQSEEKKEKGTPDPAKDAETIVEDTTAVETPADTVLMEEAEAVVVE
ncbi:MAG: hypothetical protein JW801_13685 [Bacteroidales bacterium]|nr:hypothetical protein [Bacteroidales bacterium]